MSFEYAPPPRYFRQRLQQLGCVVYGHDDSPVVPMMLYSPVKVNEIVLNLHARKVATVGVGFPATNMTEERTREGPIQQDK